MTRAVNWQHLLDECELNVSMWRSFISRPMSMELRLEFSQEASDFVAMLEEARAECDDAVLSFCFGILVREARQYLV